MTRETLEKILEQAPGTTRKDAEVAVEPEHRATLYLDIAGQGSGVAEVVKLVLAPSFLRVETKDRSVHFVGYEQVVALVIRPPREPGAPARTGF